MAWIDAAMARDEPEILATMDSTSLLWHFLGAAFHKSFKIGHFFKAVALLEAQSIGSIFWHSPGSDGRSGDCSMGSNRESSAMSGSALPLSSSLAKCKYHTELVNITKTKQNLQYLTS